MGYVFALGALSPSYAPSHGERAEHILGAA